MRERIAQSLLIMYGAGLNDGQCGLEHPSLVITDQLDKLTREICEEIEKVENPYDKYEPLVTHDLPSRHKDFEETRDKILTRLRSKGG